MQKYYSIFERKLAERIHEKISYIKDQLANNVSVQNIEDYRHKTGQISALQSVFDMMEDTNEELNKGE